MSVNKHPAELLGANPQDHDRTMDYGLFTAILREAVKYLGYPPCTASSILLKIDRSLSTPEFTNLPPDDEDRSGWCNTVIIIPLSPRERRVIRTMKLGSYTAVRSIVGSIQDLIATPRCYAGLTHTTLTAVHERVLPTSHELVSGVQLDFDMHRVHMIQAGDYEMILRLKMAECEALSLTEVALLLTPAVPLTVIRIPSALSDSPLGMYDGTPARTQVASSTASGQEQCPS